MMCKHLYRFAAFLIVIALAAACGQQPSAGPAAANRSTAPPAASAGRVGELKTQFSEVAPTGAANPTPVTLNLDFDGLVALVAEGSETKPSRITAMAVKASEEADRQRLPSMSTNFLFKPPFHFAYLKVATKNLLATTNPQLAATVGDAFTLIALVNDDITIPALMTGSGPTLTDPNLAHMPHLQDISGHGKVSDKCFAQNGKSDPFAIQRIAARLPFNTGTLATTGPVRLSGALPSDPLPNFEYATLTAKIGPSGIPPGAEVDLKNPPPGPLYGATELSVSVPQGFVDVTITSFAPKPAPAPPTSALQFRLSPAPGEKAITLSLLDLPAAEVTGADYDGQVDAGWASHFLWFYTLTDNPPGILPVPRLVGPPNSAHSDPYCSGASMVH